MSKLLKIGVLLSLLAFSICIIAPTVYQVDAKTSWTTYRSPDGWSVSYPSDMIKDVNDDGSLFLQGDRFSMLINPVEYPYLHVVSVVEDQETILLEDGFKTVNGNPVRTIVVRSAGNRIMIHHVVGGYKYTYWVKTQYHNGTSVSREDILEIGEIGSIVATISD